MTIVQEAIESHESKLSFGLYPEEKVMFRTYPDGAIKSPFPNIVASLWFHMSLDKINHSRTIYGTLDLLGDIGGLSDAFFALGGIIVTFFSFLMGNNLDKLLI